VLAEFRLREESWELWRDLADECGMTADKQLEVLAHHLSNAPEGIEIVTRAKQSLERARSEALATLAKEVQVLLNDLTDSVHEFSDVSVEGGDSEVNATITKLLWIREELEHLRLKIK
jgi:hypothetical protein